MIYNEQLTLTANTPLPYDCININCSRLHFLQINDIAVVTVRVTLQIGQPPVELESITGPRRVSNSITSASIRIRIHH